MIGKIKTGKSFGGCIRYLLENKVKPNNKMGYENSRAEILSYNQCFGNKNELIDWIFLSILRHGSCEMTPIIPAQTTPVFW